MLTPTLMPVIIANNSASVGGDGSLGAPLWMLCSILLLILLLIVTFARVEEAYKNYDLKKAERIFVTSGVTYIVLIVALIPFFASLDFKDKDNGSKSVKTTGTRDGVSFVCEEDKWQNNYCTPLKKDTPGE